MSENCIQWRQKYNNNNNINFHYTGILKILSARCVAIAKYLETALKTYVFICLVCCDKCENYLGLSLVCSKFQHSFNM